jgi:hypothetical protein
LPGSSPRDAFAQNAFNLVRWHKNALADAEGANFAESMMFPKRRMTHAYPVDSHTHWI